VAHAADAIFGVAGTQITPACAWLGIACYALQIYFDFSGYSDMAIGLGHMFGFRFPENFNYPYIADSMTDFWRRWHISLSSWFRDYLYIPLGGNRVSPERMYLNLLIVFFLCGLWHGATWNFIVWGLFHGAFLILERAGFGEWLKRRNVVLRHAYTLVAILVGWVFFRAETIGGAFQYLGRMAFIWTEPGDVGPALYVNGQLLAAIAAGLIGAVPWLPRARGAWAKAVANGGGARAAGAVLAGRTFELAALAGVFLISCGLSAAGTYNPFIYFRF
jgi:alginate O-acetyltransferase complex protein AlgI